MRLYLLALLHLFAGLAQATPGGLDASGCHHPRNKEFHCHVPRAQGKEQGRGETTAQREKRLRRECRGRPNAGACLGYARQAAESAR
jgi:hypothetical protein